MVRLNLNSDGVRNCKETTKFVKEREKKLLNVTRKESSIWGINKDFYLKNPNSSTSLNSFNDVEIC